MPKKIKKPTQNKHPPQPKPVFFLLVLCSCSKLIFRATHSIGFCPKAADFNAVAIALATPTRLKSEHVWQGQYYREFPFWTSPSPEGLALLPRRAKRRSHWSAWIGGAACFGLRQWEAIPMVTSTHSGLPEAGRCRVDIAGSADVSVRRKTRPPTG